MGRAQALMEVSCHAGISPRQRSKIGAAETQLAQSVGYKLRKGAALRCRRGEPPEHGSDSAHPSSSFHSQHRDHRRPSKQAVITGR